MSPTQRAVTLPRRRSPARRAIRIALVVAGLVVVLGIAAFAAAYTLIGVPSPNQLAQSQTSIVYYADGKNEIGRFSSVNRESVTLKSIPKTVQHAMLAAEDRDFYSNPGFSPTGIGRALWAAASGGDRQGGSTITQQYVKNYFLTQDQTLGRKAKELIISLKVEQELSKDEILENYFNTIYYGRGAYGVQAASRAYFDKPVSQLTVGEGALLASVIRAPALYDPALGESQSKNARDRVKYVLDGMVTQGWLSAAERRRVAFPEVRRQTPRQTASGPNGYLMAYVKNELATTVGLSDKEIDRGGLRITTTIDKQDQQAAIDAVNSRRPSGGKADDIRVGLASIKPGDGAIVALYGGRDYSAQPYNAATQAQLQAGSTFKVFTVVAALQKGISTHTGLDGGSPRYFDAFKGGGNPDGKVSNFGNADYGQLDVRSALAHSSNTAFAQLNIDVGPSATKDAAVSLGVPATTLGLSDNPANVFGTASVRVLDMANAYATLAAGGKRAQPYIISKVTAAQPDWMQPYQASPAVTEAVGADVAADTLDAMQEVVRSGTAQKAQELGRPAAGKTGTTDENRAVWFDGVTPQLATAVGMYLPDAQGNAQPLRGIGGISELTGGSYPVSIWTAYMRKALDGTPAEDFPQRMGIGDDRTGGWAPPQQSPEPTTDSTTSDWFPAPQQTSEPTETTPAWTPTDTVPPPAAPSPDAPHTPQSSRTSQRPNVQSTETPNRQRGGGVDAVPSTPGAAAERRAARRPEPAPTAAPAP